MKKILNIIIAFFLILILLFVIFHLQNSYKIILSEFYEMYAKNNTLQVSLISFGYSFSSIFIILFYRTQNKYVTVFIRFLFVIIDVLVLATMYNESLQNYLQISVYLFAIYTGLILLFVGDFAHRYIYKHINNNDLEQENKVLQSNIKDFEKTLKTLEDERIGLHENIADFEIEIENLTDKNKEVYKSFEILAKEKKDYENKIKDFDLMFELSLNFLVQNANMNKNKLPKNELWKAFFNEKKDEYLQFDEVLNKWKLKKINYENI